MLGILLVIDLIAFAMAVYAVRGQREFLRESVLTGFVLWGCAVMAATEGLSLFQALGFREIFIFWVMILGLCTGIIYKNRAGLNVKGIFYSRRENAADTASHWPFLEKVFFNRIVFFSFCLGIIALVAPPNTYDAMTYHMARVMHWIQDHGVTYYPTHIPRQLYYPVFAEYVILHFQLLSGGDHWANFVQWLSMGGSLIGVSLIARELGVAQRGQILSALIVVTIPMGILQSSSTQTDYVETLWLCIFIYFFLCWRRTFSHPRQRRGWGYALLAGAGLGLAVGTKGVAMILGGPFLLWMLIAAARRMSVRNFMMIGLVACLAALFYTGSFYRNFVFFHGNPAKIISADADSLVNARFCWEGFASNVLRNTGLHLSTPSKNVNSAIGEGISRCASFLHIDLNRKDWSYMGYSFSVPDFSSNESGTGNLLHLFLFLAVLLMFIISPYFRNRDAVFYLAACFLGWVAFNWTLKWQPWNTRFHLPMFVILAPLAGLVMERITARWVVSGTMGALFLSAWVFVFLNIYKPVFSTLSIFYPQNRDFLHFMATASPQSTYLEYEGVAQALHKRGCKNIGLIMGPDENEYLLWVALNPTADPAMRIESVLVNNASANLKYPLGDFVPDAIIAVNDDRSWVNWENNIYQVVWYNEITGKRISILLMKSPTGQ